MGTTPTAEVPHGLLATILAENEFGNVIVPFELVVPQEDFTKVCFTEAGGG